MSSLVDRLVVPNVVPMKRVGDYLVEIVFIATAVIIPAVCHTLNVPVFVVLPMHWTIVLSGLVFGWKAGLVSGLAAPIIATLLTGMPPLMVLPLMTAELAVYGFLPGLLREKGVNSWLATAVGLVSGRFVFILAALSLGRVSGGLAPYIKSVFMPGAVSGLLQIALLPLVAAGCIALLNKDNNRA